MVSVVIPTFNRHKSLIRAVESVINQSFTNFEIIIVNDNIHDFEVKRLITKFEDPRCRTINNKRNKGANGARNSGILEAKGTHIAFLDDDDVWDEYYLEKQINFLDANKVFKAVFSGFKKTNYKNISIEKIFAQELITITNLIKNNFGIGASSTLIVKKDIFSVIDMWDEKLQRFQDLELLLRILKNNYLLHNPTVLVEIPDGNQGFDIRKLFNSYGRFYKKAIECSSGLSVSELISIHFYLLKKPLSLSVKYIISQIK